MEPVQEGLEGLLTRSLKLSFHRYIGHLRRLHRLQKRVCHFFRQAGGDKRRLRTQAQR